jgi:Tol biopolymer transport system component
MGGPAELGADKSGMSGMPVFSPNGERVAFWDATASALKTVGIDGQGARTLVGLDSNVTDIDWDDRGMLTFVLPQGIFEVSEKGGDEKLIVSAEDGERLGSPNLLPDMETLLFTAKPADGGWNDARIMTYSLKSGQRKLVWQGGRDARYVRTGHIVFARGDTLSAIPFDLSSLQRAGDPVGLEEHVIRSASGGSDTAQYAISDTGTLLYVVDDTSVYVARSLKSLVFVDRLRRKDPVPVRPNYYQRARFSPDGNRVVLSVGGGPANTGSNTIWMYDTVTENLKQLTFDGDDFNPVWCGNESILFFSRNDSSVYSIPAEGGKAEVVAPSPDFLPLTSSCMGQTLFVRAFKQDITFSVAALNLADRQFKELLPGDPLETDPELSPNQKLLAYTA